MDQAVTEKTKKKEIKNKTLSMVYRFRSLEIQETNINKHLAYDAALILDENKYIKKQTMCQGIAPSLLHSC